LTACPCGFTSLRADVAAQSSLAWLAAALGASPTSPAANWGIRPRIEATVPFGKNLAPIASHPNHISGVNAGQTGEALDLTGTVP